MAVKIVLVVTITLAALFQGTAALKCYSCIGSKTSECSQSKVSSMGVDTCDRITLTTKELLPGLRLNDTYAIKAQCVSTIVKPIYGYEKPLMLRACAPTYENKSVCNLLIEQGFPVESCHWCDDKDNCNGY